VQVRGGVVIELQRSGRRVQHLWELSLELIS
jgi:hypothetical protein